MNLSDPIADMLTRIRNANGAGLKQVQIPHSGLKTELARILKKEGYIADYVTEGHGGKKTLCLYLKYGYDHKPIIQGLRRISKPGLRVYAQCEDLPKVLGGLGVAIISTSKGIMTDKAARKENLGGEVLCYIW